MSSTDAGNSAEWFRFARTVRQALEMVGVTQPRCMPGEDQDCGNGTAAHHAMAYTAALAARAEDMLWHFHHGESEEGMQLAVDLLHQWQYRMAETPCDHPSADGEGSL